MEQPLIPDVLKDIWDKITPERKNQINSSIHIHMDKMVKSSNENKIELQPNNIIRLNFAFDKEEPIQFIYIEGVVSFIKIPPQGHIAAVIKISYIQVSDNVDSFLDRMNDIQNSDGFKSGIGINETNTISDSQYHNLEKLFGKPLSTIPYNFPQAKEGEEEQEEGEDEDFNPLDILMYEVEKLVKKSFKKIGKKGINVTIKNITIKNITIKK